jgi:single-stranded DNA-binding protein
MRKGSKLAVYGRIEVRKYNDKYYTNIVVEEIEFADNNKTRKEKSDDTPQEDFFPLDGDPDIPF